ncbi:MAG: hypothetical protein AB7S26_30865 [Sandaracinaceae bacterium]
MPPDGRAHDGRARPRRRPLTLAALAIGLALLIATGALGQVRTASTIDVSEIHPGMRGYGLTVFRGTQPERFDVEVIDVLHNFRPDQDLILVRTPHPILEHAHVVAGMSGSPVYLDGRLAGAYAYGWPYSADAVAGVTPIRNMLVELRRPVRPDAFDGAAPFAPTPRRGGARPTARLAPNLHGLPPYLGAEPATATSALEAHAARYRPTAGSTATLVPAATPLMVGGLDDAVVRSLDEQLGGFGLMTLQAGGAGPATPPSSAPSSYVDGGAVGIALVRGDIAATAVGTVTHVEGQRVVGFGHPMMNSGEPGLPTMLVRVLHILASVQRSFKISEPIRPLGTLVQDRQSGIVVDTRADAQTVPVRLRLRGVPNAPRTEWNVELASHRVLTPVLLAAAINNALQASSSDNADVSYEATSRLWVSGRPDPHELIDRGHSSGGANAASLRELRVFSMLEAIYGNPFEVSRATRIEIDLDIRFARDVVQILDASVAAEEVDPGSTVPVRVILQRYGQPEEVRMVEVRIPERLAGQSVQVRIEGGGAVHPERPQPRSLDEILANVHTDYANTALVVSTRTPQRGLRFAGHVAEHLPPSALDTLQLRNDADRARPFLTFDRSVMDLGAVVSGNASVDLEVRRSPQP